MELNDLITLEEQECEDENFDFNVQVVVTQNLLHNLERFKPLTPQQILFVAHSMILEKYEGRNIDYLQVFHIKGYKFWAISNKLKDEEYDPNIHCLTFLDPSDY